MPSYKKCQPGVICVENITLSLILLILFIMGYLIYANNSSNKNIHNSQKIVIEDHHQQQQIQQQPSLGLGYFGIPNYPYNNYPRDVYLNPYSPPLKDERYLVPQSIPINVSTNIGAVDTAYRQTGILTPLNGASNKILPLMGRPLFVNRNKWQYYTLSDQNNSVKLPIVKNGRSCTNEYGCDNLYNGDSVYVEGYNQAFKVTVYDNDTIKYIPFL